MLVQLQKDAVTFDAVATIKALAAEHGLMDDRACEPEFVDDALPQLSEAVARRYVDLDDSEEQRELVLAYWRFRTERGWVPFYVRLNLLETLVN